MTPAQVAANHKALTNLAELLAAWGPHNPATVPHCGQCDETRILRTRFGAIPCPNCNPAAEESA